MLLALILQGGSKTSLIGFWSRPNIYNFRSSKKTLESFFSCKPPFPLLHQYRQHLCTGMYRALFMTHSAFLFFCSCNNCSITQEPTIKSFRKLFFLLYILLRAPSSFSLYRLSLTLIYIFSSSSKFMAE